MRTTEQDRGVEPDPDGVDDHSLGFLDSRTAPLPPVQIVDARDPADLYLRPRASGRANRRVRLSMDRRREQGE
jgi:hypothetical protein